MNRRTSLLLRLGLAAVLALGAVGVITGPAFAHVLAVTIEDGTVAQPGGVTATVSGTLTCTHGSGGVFVSVGQTHGQRVITGFAFIGYVCSGSQPQAWSVTVFSLQGFEPGPANVIASVSNFSSFDGFNFVTGADTVHLHPE